MPSPPVLCATALSSELSNFGVSASSLSGSSVSSFFAIFCLLLLHPAKPFQNDFSGGLAAFYLRPVLVCADGSNFFVNFFDSFCCSDHDVASLMLYDAHFPASRLAKRIWKYCSLCCRERFCFFRRRRYLSL